MSLSVLSVTPKAESFMLHLWMDVIEYFVAKSIQRSGHGKERVHLIKKYGDLQTILEVKSLLVTY